MELLAAEKHQVEALKNMQHRNKSLSMLDEILEDVRRAADRLELEIEEHAFDDNKAVSGPRAPRRGSMAAPIRWCVARTLLCGCVNKAVCGCGGLRACVGTSGKRRRNGHTAPRKGTRVAPRMCPGSPAWPESAHHPTPAPPAPGGPFASCLSESWRRSSLSL